MPVNEKRAMFVLCSGLLLAACAGHEATKGPEEKGVIGRSADKVEAGVSEAATSPLHDLNLRKGKIAPVLLEARKGPYQLPENTSCEAVAAELKALDAALGPDIDAPPARHEKESLARRGGEIVTDAVADAAKTAVTVAVPYKGWIRKLSGAEKYSEEVTGAIAAGGIRRSFLKGFRLARGCAVAG